MKKILHYFLSHKKLALFVLLIVGVLVFFLIPKSQGTIETQKVKRQDIIQSINASGKIESETTAVINFAAGGKVVYLGAKKGEFVKKGELIASLDTRTVQKNIEDDLKDYLKQRNEFDQTKDDNQGRLPEQALNDSMKRILQDNQYDLEKSVISVELQSLVKEQSYLFSPIDGVITQSDITVTGVNVLPTQTITVADPLNVVFLIEVDEADIGKIEKDMPVKLTLESYVDKPIDLVITDIDFTSHTSANGGIAFNVEARFADNSDYKYRIGMTGDAEIVVSESKDVISVPLGSVVDETHVYVKKDEVFEKRKVDLGIQNDTDVEIKNGLSVGEEVAILPDEVINLQKNKKQFIFF